MLPVDKKRKREADLVGHEESMSEKHVHVLRVLVPAEIVDEAESLFPTNTCEEGKTLEENKVRLKIIKGWKDAAVMITVKGGRGASQHAVDSLLEAHEIILKRLEGSSHPHGSQDKFSTRLLVSKEQAEEVEREQREFIEEEENCIFHIHEADGLLGFSLLQDYVLEVVGDPRGSHMAVRRIASLLVKNTVHSVMVPVIEALMEKVPTLKSVSEKSLSNVQSVTPHSFRINDPRNQDMIILLMSLPLYYSAVAIIGEDRSILERILRQSCASIVINELPIPTHLDFFISGRWFQVDHAEKMIL